MHNQRFVVFPLNTLLSFLSLVIVSWGQPAGIPWLSFLASTCGYAFFWFSIRYVTSPRKRFFYATTWFSIVQGLQLSWMTSIDYQGYYILFVYVGICLWLGCQFGLLVLIIAKSLSFHPMRVLAIASLWTIVEWARLHILCGFSWNPVGLALSTYLPSMQLAALGGVFFLTFWVMLTNLWFYKCLLIQKMRPHRPEAWDLEYANSRPKTDGGIKLTWIIVLICLIGCPWIFGSCRLLLSPKNFSTKKVLSVLLLQTGLLPSEKAPLSQKIQDFISPYEQWRKILHSLSFARDQKIDLIVLPETAVPFSSDAKLYALKNVKEIFCKELKNTQFIAENLNHHAEYDSERGWCVSNLFWAQGLANALKSSLLIGMDHQDPISSKSYNAALFLKPEQTKLERYEKRVLVPLAEYLPFEWLKPFVKSYGITEFFHHGQESKIFYHEKTPFTVSICYEETFPEIVREGCKKGAHFLVNLTNDNWYPFSTLPKMHFYHGRLRAVENGLPLLRACNTGLTCAIDPYGKLLSQIYQGEKSFERLRKVLPVTLHLQKVETFYSRWGDSAIIGISFFFLLSFMRLKKTYYW